jgi:hypothetical protein
LPARLLDPAIARTYCGGESASVREKAGKVVLSFLSEDEEGGDWVEVEALVSSKQPRSYDQAVGILVDLRDLAARGKAGAFSLRIEALRETQTKKPAFIQRLTRAGL